jgi:hypothetical protein
MAEGTKMPETQSPDSPFAVLGEIETYFKREAMIYQGESKRDMCRFYGVTMEMVDVECYRWQAIWRCSQWDKHEGATNGTHPFPDEARIQGQIDNPNLPA